MVEHAEHEVVTAYARACIDGECEHIDEHGDGSLDECPSIAFDVCVDCMDEKGAGRSEEEWDDWALEPWPHPGSAGWTETASESPDSGSSS